MGLDLLLTSQKQVASWQYVLQYCNMTHSIFVTNYGSKLKAVTHFA